MMHASLRDTKRPQTFIRGQLAYIETDQIRPGAN